MSERHGPSLPDTGYVVRCSHDGCNRGVDSGVYPKALKSDGTYDCGLHCSCGAKNPCPKVHAGTFTREHLIAIREIIAAELNDNALVYHDDRYTVRRLAAEVADRIEALLPPEEP